MIWKLTARTLTGINFFMKKYYLLLIPTLLYVLSKPYSIDSANQGQVLGVATSAVQIADVVANETTIATKTSFKQKEIVETEEIPFDFVYKDDNTAEYGTEKIVTAGVDGEIKTKYLLTYWVGEIIDKTQIGIETIEPQSQIVARGTKVVWRTLNTDVGPINYWRKLHVWATKYDGHCPGCRGLTYSGTTVQHGVCAVDPKVIPLGTNFYVIGYGMCRSEDIGGAIKGNRVDLGFVDASTGAWGSAYTDVYLMTSSPDGTK